MSFLPPNLANRLSQRAQHAVLSACALPTAQKQVLPAHLLHSLNSEEGSLAKSILGSHHITSSYTARLFSKHTQVRRDLASEQHQNAPIRFSEQSRAILKRAIQIAARQQQPYIGTEHLLYAIVCQDGIWDQYLLKKKLKKIKTHLDHIFSQGMRFPDVLNKWKSHALDDFPDSFPGILRSGAKKFRKRHNSFSSKTKRRASKKIAEDVAPNRHSHLPIHEHEHGFDEHGHEERHSKTPALDAFCENLAMHAKKGLLDPVIGREKEIARMVHILSRRTKNNPLLIGEPGVGKTAIVHALAQRIHQGEVPGNLLHAQIYALNLNSLVAGTMFRGDFEARMQDLLDEASGRDVILFIDEIHTVIGAGAGAGSLDVANILKPGLSQGTLRAIGATTLEEYRKYIEKDRALERRFQPVLVEEETEEQSVQTLMQLKKLYEQHHGITIGTDAIEAAVTLSSRYIRDRYLPDKALDVLDEAASRLRSSMAITERTKKIRELEQQKLALVEQKENATRKENYEQAIILKREADAADAAIRRYRENFPLFSGPQTLTRRDVEKTVSEITGIPIQKAENDAQKLHNLSRFLNREIIGQKEAIASLVQTILRNKAGLGNPARPTGSYLFLGPSGVGKTALAYALSQAHNQPLVKLDMSEYAEPYTISRLIGSPPGYVGYGESGELTERLRRNPYAVVLFDEVEKAHPSVHNLLLSILDEGTIRDATGRLVSLKNAIIILTSNAGTEHETNEGHLGFSVFKESKPLANTALHLAGIKELLRPELLNRIDKVVTFRVLDKKDIAQITKLHIEKLKKRLLPMRLRVSKETASRVAEHAYKPGQGARFVRATIEEMLEEPLAEYLIRHQGAKDVKVQMAKGKIMVRGNHDSYT